MIRVRLCRLCLSASCNHLINLVKNDLLVSKARQDTSVLGFLGRGWNNMAMSPGLCCRCWGSLVELSCAIIAPEGCRTGLEAVMGYPSCGINWWEVASRSSDAWSCPRRPTDVHGLPTYYHQVL